MDNPSQNQNSDHSSDDSPSTWMTLSRPHISLKRFAFYFITLGVLILIYIKFAELKLIGSLFTKSNYYWLAGIITLQVFSYLFQALNYRDVLRIKDLEVSAKELYPMSFVVQFLNQALPSAGLSGQVFFIQYLKKYGLTVAEGIGRALLEVMTLYMAFGTFFIISSIIIFNKDTIADVPEIRFFIYGFIIVAIIALLFFFFIQGRKRSRIAIWITGWLHRYFEKKKKKRKRGEKITDHSEHAKMIFEQFNTSLSIKTLQKRKKPFWAAYFWQNMIILSNILTLYFISFSIGYPISFWLAFIVFTLVKFISMVAFVPGALGVFEGGMTLIFVSFGVPAEPAFAMTLLLRAFTFWFPMPIGWLLYRLYFHRHEMDNPYEGLQH